MCGIAGELRWDGSPPSRTSVADMLVSLRARGPDGEGLVSGETWVFGHRRLAVIDPTERSAQPMTDAMSGLTLVYNGALYEYRAVRAQLEALGYRFVSDGDTEVVLKAYHAWGTDCVRHLRGMFAFAITDQAGRTFLARDRMGIKPLYWSATSGRFRFASTLPALLAAGDVDSTLDPVALQQFCTLHGIVIAPRTIVAAIRKLPPATWMLVEADGTRKEETYWQFERAPDRTLGPRQWALALRDALMASVRRRRVADTDVGVLLSGGLDSSLITAMLHADGATASKTFSVGFESVRGEAGDEFAWSDVVAQRFGTEHTQLRVSQAETLGALPEAIAAMSEPMVSHDAVGFFLLGRAVRQHVKVVQSGQGADELLGGYHWHARLLHASGGASAYASAFFDRDYAAYQSMVEPAWSRRDTLRPWLDQQFAQCSANTTIDATLQIDGSVMLTGDPVPRLDTMMMASGVEARTPFLDEDVVAVASRIPAELSVSTGKAVLKAVAREFLPQPWVDRPKGYFPVPALRWIEGAFLEQMRGWLTSQRARSRGLFRRTTVDGLLAAPSTTLTPLGGSTLWQLAVLEAWLQQNNL